MKSVTSTAGCVAPLSLPAKLCYQLLHEPKIKVVYQSIVSVKDNILRKTNLGCLLDNTIEVAMPHGTL
jgi:hypothetical protein